MSLIYFAGLVAAGRRRLSVRPLARGGGRADRAAAFAPDLSRRLRRHRRPGADAADLRDRRCRSPTASWSTQALAAFDPAIVDDDLCAAAPCCATSSRSPRAAIPATPSAGAASRPPTPMRRCASWANTLILGAGLVFGLLGIAFGLRSLVGAISAPAIRSSASSRSFCSLRRRRGADHDRHRVLGAVRDRALLPEGLAARIPVRPAMVPADRDARRPGRLVRRLRHRAAGHRHAADHHHRHADRRADRPVRGDLHGRICDAALPRLRQADPRNPRRHSDRGARLLRGADAGALDPRARAVRSASTSPPRARSPPAS